MDYVLAFGNVFFFFLKKVFIYLAALGLSCGIQALSFWCTGFSLVAVRRLNCPVLGGVSVPGPELNPTSPALEADS